MSYKKFINSNGAVSVTHHFALIPLDKLDLFFEGEPLVHFESVQHIVNQALVHYTMYHQQYDLKMPLVHNNDRAFLYEFVDENVPFLAFGQNVSVLKKDGDYVQGALVSVNEYNVWVIEPEVDPNTKHVYPVNTVVSYNKIASIANLGCKWHEIMQP